MNRKTLSIAVMSALYGASVAAAAQSAAGHQLQQAIMPAAAPVQTMTESLPQQTTAQGVYPGGRNMQIAPASAAQKFKAEADRAGMTDTYIVRLRDASVATYDGRLPGYEATAQGVIRKDLVAAKAAKGIQISADQLSESTVSDVQNNRVSAYEKYLGSRQDAVLQQAQALGVQGDASSRYTHALNGFALKMTQEQAAQLASSTDVAYIQRAETLELLTDRGPQFIKADQVWTGNNVNQTPYKGDGIVVGIIDTGINSDHEAFQDLGENGGKGYDHTNPLGKGNYLGECATGVKQCNDKLIGIYSWPVVTNTYQGKAPATGEDYNGHGSHTAGTAAGNYIENVPMLSGGIDNSDGRPYGPKFASASGVAPHANIVAYQACIANGGCPGEAILLAYEQAIKDGVDVINFSIGGGERFPWEDPMQQAILAAREAGISVAVAAGNNGHNGSAYVYGSLSHTSPWSMVVAASTHDRTMTKVNNLVSFTGGKKAPFVSINPNSVNPDHIAGYSNGNFTGKPVNAADFGDELCLKKFAPNTFQPDQIVICKRGQNGRIEKSENVKAGGAGGFILYNDVFDSVNRANNEIYDDFYELPGLHVVNSAGKNILAWMKDGGTDHQITITGGSITIGQDPAVADRLAQFSSMGPALTYLHHLAPNVSAPGVDILAPYADEHPLEPGGTSSRDWAIISGTSMATPHVAGAMALIRQAHPEWTAAEVQSALEMTASNTVTRNHASTPDGKGHPATQHRAGSGRIDVQAAVNSGLIMDETVDNFVAANPKTGGNVRQLNLPQLVDSECKRGICSWTRTVKATRDGSWTVSGGEWAYDRYNRLWEGEIDMNNAKMEFFPAKFSLKAGESQTIVIKANVQDIQQMSNSMTEAYGKMENLELWSQVYLTADNPDIPQAHWPVSVNFDRLGLPDVLNFRAHRNIGTQRLDAMVLPASDNLAYNMVGSAKATVFEVTLPQDSNHIPVFNDNDYSPGHIETKLINVPANSARLVAEVLEHVKEAPRHPLQGPMKGAMQIYVGRDSNNNGKPDLESEWLCASTTQIELNFCSINNPDPGNYWVMLINSRFNAADNANIPNLLDTYKVATAVVPANADKLTVSGPMVSDGVKPVAVDLKWNIADAKPGDIIYSGLKIGTSATADAIGFVPLRIERGIDDISMNVPKKATVGTEFEVDMHVVENNSGMDRDFDLSAKLPKGLTLVPGSVSVNHAEQKANLTVTGDTIRIAGTQKDSSDWLHSYKVTDSDTDASCQVPNYGRNGKGFVGLAKTYGFLPTMGGKADDWAGMVVNGVYTDAFLIKLADWWGAGATMNLFQNEKYVKYNQFRVSPQGFVSFGDAWFDYQHLMQSKFPYYMSPYGAFVAPFWRGQVDLSGIGLSIPVEALSTPLVKNNSNPAAGSGIAMGFTNDEIILEWINARTERFTFNQFGAKPTKPETIRDDRYTFNLILNKNYRYGQGEFELVMAYDTMDFGTQGDFGSIGLHGHYGPLDVSNYPYRGEGEKGIQYAYDGLKNAVKQNKVVCYDYTGPEATQFDVKFKVRVAETAAGQTLNMDWVSNVTGLDQVTLSNPIQVAGTVTLAELKDLQVDENKSVDFNVLFADSENDAKVISVSAANVTAKVNGHDTNSTVTLTPNKDWHGKTTVTVTVADKLVPSDKATATFELTVKSDGVEPVVVTPQPEPKPEPAKSSGGAAGGFLLALLPLLWFRRRKA